MDITQYQEYLPGLPGLNTYHVLLTVIVTVIRYPTSLANKSPPVTCTDQASSSADIFTMQARRISLTSLFSFLFLLSSVSTNLGMMSPLRQHIWFSASVGAC